MLKIILTILAGLYALSQFDVLPESIMGWMGWIDDIVILYLLWRFFYAPGRPSGRAQDFYRQYRNQDDGRSPGENAAGDTVGGHRQRDPYDVLGIARDASQEEIKRAYKQLVNQYHPDKVHHLADEFRELAEKRFKEIQAAYDALGRQ